MKKVLLAALLPVASAQDIHPSSITLDPRVMTAALEGRPVEADDLLAVPGDCGTAARWWKAMQAVDSEKGVVLLLALLQELNADVPMASHPDLYAEALAWHRAAAWGREDACLLLAQALGSGRLPNGLSVPRSDDMARRVALHAW